MRGSTSLLIDYLRRKESSLQHSDASVSLLETEYWRLDSNKKRSSPKFILVSWNIACRLVKRHALSERFSFRLTNEGRVL